MSWLEKLTEVYLASILEGTFIFPIFVDSSTEKGLTAVARGSPIMDSNVIVTTTADTASTLK